jgi:hypothetical protein
LSLFQGKQKNKEDIKMSQEENKNQIDLTFGHGGNEIFLTQNVHQKIKHVLEKALAEFKKEFNLDPPANSQPIIRYGDLNLDDLEKSLEDYNVPDKAVLDLLFQTRAGC